MLTIENDVLVKCDENATEVVIPADVKQIKKNAFEGCKSLKVLRFPKDFDFEYLYDDLNPYDMRDENELYYGKIDTFLIDSLTDVYYEGSIADWIKATGYFFFKENVKIHCSDGDAAPITPNMEKIVIPNGVTEIPHYAFFGYSCKEIEIPDSITDIGRFALCNTSNLKTITLPAGLNDIGENAFQESGIETIYFKGAKEQWKKVYKDSPWGTYCELREWMVSIVHCSDGDAPFFDKDVVINDNGVLYGPSDFFIFDYNIPVNVKKIEKYAFELENNDPRDNDFDLTYEGTKEQWFKIDKGENWDGNKVFVVHCSDGDIQINNGGKELDEKLLDAVSEGTLEEVKKLIIAGANVNAANDSKGGNALNIALNRDFKEIAEFLIKQGSDVNGIQKKSFIAVVERGSKELVELLLAHGINVNVVFDYGRTALMIAACKSNKEMIELLIEHGADVNIAISEQYGVRRNWDFEYISVGTTVLMEVVKNGSLEITKLLLEHGANINAVEEHGETALMFAARYNGKEIAKLLVERGADVNAVNKQGSSTYEIFIHFYGKNSGIVEFLVQHGAKTNFHNLFIEAIKNNNTDEVLKFINNGADLNLSLIPSEYTPLMIAAKYDSKEVAELLIEHGAEVNHEPLEYYFPLSAAAEWNAKNVAEVLINHGARLDADDSLDRDDYYTFGFLRPWDYAIINNSKDVIEVFLNHGYACDKVGIYDEVEDNFKNSIAYAEEHNFTELAELLKKHLKKS